MAALWAGAVMVMAAWLEVAWRAASMSCASWLLKSTHAKRVAATELATTEACAVLALRAAALVRSTFFLIDGSGFFANLVAICVAEVLMRLGGEQLPQFLVSMLGSLMFACICSTWTRIREVPDLCPVFNTRDGCGNMAFRG